MRAVDVDQRNSPTVFARRMQCHAVVRPRQHLAETEELHFPAAGTTQSLFELRADADFVPRAIPGAASRVALETEATLEINVRSLGEIDVARQVETRRSPSVVVAVEKSGIRTRCANTHHVIHEIAADGIGS